MSLGKVIPRLCPILIGFLMYSFSSFLAFNLLIEAEGEKRNYVDAIKVEEKVKDKFKYSKY